MATDPAGDALLDALAAGLTPVRRRSAARDAAVLAGFAAVETLLYVVLRGGMRPDMPAAMGRMAFWWKVASLVVLAVIGVGATLAALDPVRSPRPGLRVFAAAGTAAVALGWALDAAYGTANGTPHGGTAALVARLDWRQGVDCLKAVVVLSLPALAALVVVLRRGAPTDAAGTGVAAGIAAAAWGGAVFTVACPSDDPLYVVVWFAAAMAVVALVARFVVPRLTRW